MRSILGSDRIAFLIVYRSGNWSTDFRSRCSFVFRRVRINFGLYNAKGEGTENKENEDVAMKRGGGKNGGNSKKKGRDGKITENVIIVVMVIIPMIAISMIIQ